MGFRKLMFPLKGSSGLPAEGSFSSSCFDSAGRSSIGQVRHPFTSSRFASPLYWDRPKTDPHLLETQSRRRKGLKRSESRRSLTSRAAQLARSRRMGLGFRGHGFSFKFKGQGEGSRGLGGILFGAILQRDPHDQLVVSRYLCRTKAQWETPI